jgi:hypothetical protein
MNPVAPGTESVPGSWVRLFKSCHPDRSSPILLFRAAFWRVGLRSGGIESQLNQSQPLPRLHSCTLTHLHP